jgi:uncharacterized protein (DUF362 family)
MKRAKLDRKSHSVYSKTPSTVHIVYRKNKRRCLELAVERSGFITHLNIRFEKSGKSKKDFRIAIKPNFMCAAYETDISVYTDVELVEHLIELMRKEGYTRFTLVESEMVWSLMRRNRTVKRVAAMLGYSGEGYEIIDLTKTSSKPQNHNYGPPLGEHPFGPAWSDADYRISFAKNKTHFQTYYTGAMKNIYGCLPEKNKLEHYHARKTREFDTCTIAILEAFPVDFAFIDAYFSGDGLAGLIRDNNPNETNTIICGENCFAVDWVQGEKMGINPEKNRVIQRAVERWGKIEIIRKGPMEVYHPWKNIWPMVSCIADHVEEFYSTSRLFCFIFAYRMHERYKPQPTPARWCIAPLRFCASMIDFHSTMISFILALILVFVIFT